MLYRVLFSTLLLAGTAMAQRSQRIPEPMMDANPFPEMNPDAPSISMAGPGFRLASISGHVSGQDGKPVHDATVRLQNVSNPATSATTETNRAGNFEITSVPPGEYEVVASKGIDSAQDKVHVPRTASDVNVNLRLSGTSSSAAGDGSQKVSVTQLQVPEKARREYDKAADGFQHNRRTDARKHVDRALEIAPHYPNALVMRALLEMEQNAAAAEQDLQLSVEADPSYAMSYLVLGAVLNNQEKYESAAATLQRGVALNPNAWQGWFELSKSALAREKFADALQAATRAQTLNTAYPEIHLLQAGALLGLHRYQDAIAEYEKYLASAKGGPNVELAQNALQQARAGLAQNAQN